MLPNLSGLSLATDAKLFDHVATRGAGKKGCVKHVEPITTEDDEDADVNCAVDGYLMFKAVEGAAEPANYSGKYVDLVVDGSPVQLTPLLKRTRAAADRRTEFERRHIEWINETFPLVCARGSGLPPVEWGDSTNGYGVELAKITEWYFLDEVGKRGHLFLQLLDTPEHKAKMHMPMSGVFGGRYLYIALVCAAGGSGYGKYLMSMAEAASRALGCDGIALASLSNSAGFYYSQGYKFVSKWDGLPLDVSAWTEIVETPDGRTKTMLRPNLDVNPFGQPRDRTPPKRQREDKPEEGEGKVDEETDKETERGRLQRLFDDAVKRARGFYNQLSALSFSTDISARVPVPASVGALFPSFESKSQSLARFLVHVFTVSGLDEEMWNGINDLDREMLANDRDFVTEVLAFLPGFLRFASATLRGDASVVKIATVNDGMMLEHATQMLKDDDDLVRQAVYNNGFALQFASSRLRDDESTVRIAVTNAKEAIQFASDRLKADVEFVDSLLLRFPLQRPSPSDRQMPIPPGMTEDDEEVWEGIDDTDREMLANDRDFVIEVLAFLPGFLRFASATLRGDASVVKIATENDGMMLEHATQMLQDDDYIVQQAVYNNGLALQFASSRLRDDETTVSIAVSNTKQAIHFASDRLKADVEFVNSLLLRFPLRRPSPPDRQVPVPPDMAESDLAQRVQRLRREQNLRASRALQAPRRP